jgi:hypothetical protein
MGLSRQLRLPAFSAATLLLLGSVPTLAAEIEPDAERILRQMTDHLAGLKSFSLVSDASTEIVLRNGQKVQLTASGTGLFDRERGFRFTRQGSVSDLELTFDGKNLTLYASELGGYHTMALEGSNDAALDEVRHALGFEAAGGVDLLYADPYEGLLYDVESGEYYGETWIGGVRAHHLVYRAADIDWQLWVQAEGEPLPLKYVITSKWMTGAPQFTVQVREWNTKVAVGEGEFTFVAPEGGRALDAVEFDALGIAISE